MKKLKKVRVKSFILYFLLFLLAFLPRIYNLTGHSFFTDELIWMVRGKDFVFAIKKLNYEFFHEGWWTKQYSAEPIGIPGAFLIGLSLLTLARGQSKRSLNLVSDIFAGRLPVAIFGALTPVLFFYFLKKYYPKKIAILGFLFFAFDPIHIALSRWAHQDVFLTLFSFLTIILYFVGEQKNHLLAKLSSAFCFALAFLTKPSAAVVPISLAIFKAVKLTFNEENRKKFRLKNDFAWVLTSIFFIILLWPFTWENPWQKINLYLTLQRNIVSKGHANYFLGKITSNPPLYYYLVVLAIRLTEFILLGTALAFIFALKKIKNIKKLLKKPSIQLAFLFLLWAVCYLILVSLTPKKLDARYILPIWPSLILFASWGWISFLKPLFKKFSKSFYLLIILFVLYSSLVFGKFSPHYYLFYNFISGGPTNAQRYIKMGVCAGIKDAMEFIVKNYPLDKKIAIVGCPQAGQYYYPQRLNLVPWQEAEILVIELHFLRRFPDQAVVQYIKNLNPVYTVRIVEAEVAWIYEKESFPAPKDTPIFF